MSPIWSRFLEHGLSRIDAERAHRLGTRALDLAAPLLHPKPRPDLALEVMGLKLPSPLALAAGFDKNAEHLDGLFGLGFAAVEVGTVTARPQAGNPQPRLFRLPADHALLNRMGFNNDGAERVGERLARWRQAGRRRDAVVGANLGKNRDTDLADAAGDYNFAARHLAPHTDYIVINVSSPNTPGLRDLQAGPALIELIAAVREGIASVGRAELPLLAKIAPDLSDDQLAEIVEVAKQQRLSGLIATNTTVARERLQTSPRALAAIGDGGLSGRPLAERSRAVLVRLRELAGPDLVLVSAGGVSDAGELRSRITLGAAFVQAYSAFVFGGPRWPARILSELAEGA